jgi:hypothetical protein
MLTYEVTLQVFAAGGDVITVDAPDRDEAERVAKKIAIHNVDALKLPLPIQEIVINTVEEVGGKRD